MRTVNRLRTAVLEFTDAAGQLCAISASALGDREIEKILAHSIRVASFVALGLDALDAEEAEFNLSAARSAAAAMAARVHMAVNNGTVRDALGLELRTRIRVLVDAIDMARYRNRRRAA